MEPEQVRLTAVGGAIQSESDQVQARSPVGPGGGQSSDGEKAKCAMAPIIVL